MAATSALVSLEQHLRMGYHPDCDYTFDQHGLRQADTRHMAIVGTPNYVSLPEMFDAID